PKEKTPDPKEKTPEPTPAEKTPVVAETPVLGDALGGEKLYERMLKSVVWIKARQSKGLQLLVPSDNSGQAPTDLVNSAWFGKETTQGDSILLLKFMTKGTVMLLDDEDMAHGKWVQNGNNVKLTFYSGEVEYDGTLNGVTLAGTAKSRTQNWNWSGEYVRPPGGGGPGGGRPARARPG